MNEDEAVQALTEAQPKTSARWHDIDGIRRLARRRTRSRQALIAGAFVVVVTIAAVVVPHGAKHAPERVAGGLQVADRSGTAVQLVAKTEPIATADSGAEAAIVRAEQAFTIDLLKHAGAGNDNLVLSPSSLAIALSMLQNGAAGTTRDEIAKALQTSGLSTQQQNAGWAALVGDLTSTKDVTFDSANSLWLQRNLKMRAAFMDALAGYYRTGVWQVDFAHDVGGANDAINSWTKQHTDGKITKLFNPGDIDATTLLVLANAVYFDAAWQTPFDPKLTSAATFHGPGGDTQVPFMNYSGALGMSESTTYRAVQLPYTGKRFAALAIMPTQQSLSQFVSGLTPEMLSTIASMPTVTEGNLRLPKFTAESYTNLNSTLAAMGMPNAFTDRADFSAMSPTAMEVQNVVQRDYLKVDEKGTKAAAVTGIGLQPTMALSPVTFDHPFLFLVRDTKTGAILFAAQIQHPAA